MRCRYPLMRGRWFVTVWYEATLMDADEIVDDLVMAGCYGEDLKECKEALWSGEKNIGLTYANAKMHMAVVVIGEATNEMEYANTISHEVGHLAVFLADESGIDKKSEEFCYLIGDITQSMWIDAHKLICPSCGHSTNAR